VPIDFTSPDHALVWPVEIFADELAAVSTPGGVNADEQVALLLEEAFDGPAVVDRWRDAIRQHEALRAEMLLALRRAAEQGELRPPVGPRPLWSQRMAGRTGPPLDGAGVRTGFARLAVQFFTAGYFAREIPADATDPGGALGDQLGVQLGVDVWSFEVFVPRLRDDTFYDLIEALHDRAARPRRRTPLPRRPGHHRFEAFATGTGQRLYRWRVNQLLERSTLGLRLAESGEDLGRLVEVSDDAREHLIERARATPDRTRANTIDHAVALFRGRNATLDEKRSAVVALAGLLEQRRALLRTALLSADANALFQIANQFDLRHRNASQRANYDPEFLDWVFWWYLATVELTNSLLARQDYS
jgi:hypothetical protein